MQARGFGQGVADADADRMTGLQGPQDGETSRDIADDDDTHWYEVTYSTEVSLEGWFFPGPWVDGHMESARYCKKAHLGSCDKRHLHASVVDVDEERANFRWFMDEHLIHAPLQQVQLAAVIVMESSAEANSDLERYVAKCTVTNIDERIIWCDAPFCPRRDHQVLVNPSRNRAAEAYFGDGTDAVARLPWVLPTVIPEWPMDIKAFGTDQQETLEALWDDISEPRAIDTHEDEYSSSTSYEYSRAVTCAESSSMANSLYERATGQVLIHIGHDIVKDMEVWHDNQKTRSIAGEWRKPQNSVPKRVYDAWTGEIVPYISNTAYAALSYVWAQHSEKTTLSTIKKLSSQLRIRYWWVDRLCMRTEEEKVEEISRMTGYYQNARTTIVFDRGLASVDLQNIRLSRRTWTKEDLDKFSRTLKLTVEQTTWAKRVWTLQEFILAGRVLFVTRSGLVEGYFFGSWAADIPDNSRALYMQDAPWFITLYDFWEGKLERAIAKPRFGFMDGRPIGPSNYTWPRPARKGHLSLGSAWTLARGRQCTKKVDLVYGMAALLKNNEKIVIDYKVSWTELIRRCCHWGLVEADVLTSIRTCDEDGMCWAPDAPDHNVPYLLDDDFTYSSETCGIPCKVEVTMNARGLGCEVYVPQLEVCGGPKAEHREGTWGTLDFEGISYSALFTKGSRPLDNVSCTALVVGVQNRRWVFLLLLWQVGPEREYFHTMGTCQALINEDEDELPLDRIANKAKKAIVMSGTQSGE
ncbi:hypothetical protein E8E14_007266 [Neopestalotiopsis sp. 37M]|nr:hypothetical protein E8E14_007266 [Neopestalotiopsis sp. 37M]